MLLWPGEREHPRRRVRLRGYVQLDPLRWIESAASRCEPRSLPPTPSSAPRVRRQSDDRSQSTYARRRFAKTAASSSICQPELTTRQIAVAARAPSGVLRRWRYRWCAGAAEFVPLLCRRLVVIALAAGLRDPPVSTADDDVIAGAQPAC